MCIRNCLFDKNSGTAYSSFGSQNTFINCTFGDFNTSRPLESDITGGDAFSIYNSVIRRLEYAGTPDIYFSNVPGLGGIDGNIDADPLFVDPESGDYRLQLGSPCIDSGTKVDVLLDLDGNPRPVDVVGRGDEGETSYDMGCFEFQLNPADLDADGYVNEWDLILFQEQWHDLE
jgi:hypothetical protein